MLSSQGPAAAQRRGWALQAGGPRRKDSRPHAGSSLLEGRTSALGSPAAAAPQKAGSPSWHVSLNASSIRLPFGVTLCDGGMKGD